MAINLKLNIKNRSISVKLFLITAAFFLAFISVTMVLQSIFIGSFYQSKKLQKFEKNFISFKPTFDEKYKQVDVVGLIEAINTFNTANNAQLALFDLTGEDTYSYDTKQGKFVPNSSLFSYSDKIIKSVTAEGFANQKYKDKLLKGNAVVFKSIIATNTLVGISPTIYDDTLGDTFVLVAISSLQPIGEASDVIR